MKTNNLKHTISVNNDTANCKINMRLNDECKNGHQDFAITAEIYEIGKNRSDRNMISGGCCHDEIIKLFPELKTFVNLHLADYTGTPMYAVENGFYHLENGFDRLEGKTQKQYFCDYYRVTPLQYDKLILSENKTEFAILLMELGILKQWRAEADKAIKELEILTGNQFIIDSVKTQFNAPNEEEIKLFKARKDSGFYSIEKKEERKTEAENKEQQKQINEVKEEAEKIIKKAKIERDVKLYILSKGFSIDNIIYYDHSNKLTFNKWDWHKKITESQFNDFCESVNFDKLPNGILFELEGVKQYAHI